MNDPGLDAIAPIERFRAQLLFLAGCIERFAENGILCYQTLVRPIETDTPRVPLPPTRIDLLLPEGRKDGSSDTLQ
jgi:hypothetical protein